METYAFLAGTLVLFFILCIIMYLTRNIKLDDPRIGSAPTDEPK